MPSAASGRKTRGIGETRRLFLRALPLLALLPASAAAADARASEKARSGPESTGVEYGVPFIRFFGPKEYSASAQNWAIAQDRRGLLYFGNNDGLLEYDGAGWRLIRTTLGSSVRSLAVDDGGRVYVGSTGDFGYLASDGSGKTRFVSLIEAIEEPFRDFSDIWSISVTPRGIYFLSREYLFRLASGRIRAWKPETVFQRCFYVGGRLFVMQPDVGLMELAGDKLSLIKGGERFARARVYGMVALDSPRGKGGGGREDRIVVSSRDGLHVLDTSGPILFPTAADGYLKRHLLYACARLSDGTLALATLRGGVVRIDSAGRLLGIVDRNSGLGDDTVYDLLGDRQGGLWLAHDKGISRVEWPSPLTLFGDASGLEGAVLSLRRHQGTLYAGTTSGAFALKPTAPDQAGASRGYRFRRVAGIDSQCWSLLSVGDTLLAATFLGLYEIRGERADRLLSFKTLGLHLLRLKSDPGRILVGLEDGLASISRRSERGPWRFDGKVPGIDEEIVGMLETDGGRLWLTTYVQTIYRVTLPVAWGGGASSPTPRIERFAAAQGVPASQYNSVGRVAGDAVFGTLSGFYRFDASGERFVADERLNRLFPGARQGVSAFCEDARGRVWMDTIDMTRNLHQAGVASAQADGSYGWEKAPLRRCLGMDADVIWCDEEGAVWFGGSDGLFRFDTAIRRDSAPVSPALVRRTEDRDGHILFDGAGRVGGPEDAPRLSHARNALRFHFALPAYDRPEANEYQTRLDGLEQEWTPWSMQNVREYTSLREGSYRFRVRARDVYGQMSGESSFGVVIDPPWQRTWLAYLAFSASGVGLLVGGTRLYTLRLRREKARLEELVALRTRELKEASLTDPLTGLRNRRYLDEILASEVAALVAYKKYLLSGAPRRRLEPAEQVWGLVVFDIDHFKQINDEHGHDAGDQVLREFAAILKSSARLDDAVVRTGGEEFLVVLKRTDPAHIGEFARRVRQRVAAARFAIGSSTEVRRTCSAGSAAFPFYASNPELLSFEQTVKLADLGLYYSKEHGRNMSAAISGGEEIPGEPGQVRQMAASLEFALARRFLTVCSEPTAREA